MPGAVRATVLGAGGFIGSAVAAALEQRGAHVQRLPAPRLSTGERTLEGLWSELERPHLTDERDRLRVELAAASVVVNAAGMADSGAGDGDALVGANALLPGLLAAAVPAGARLVHVSSAAVQGRRDTLDESSDVAPFSPYSSSKAWGEQLVQLLAPAAVCFRPTSVHGRSRPVTRALVRALRSPLASVAGSGDRPTPQVLLENVADAVAFTALAQERPPGIVLQPWEGLTTAELVRLVGRREPIHLPPAVARLAVATAAAPGARVPRMAGLSRKLEMMWFGQGQRPGWLDDRWQPVHGVSRWRELG